MKQIVVLFCIVCPSFLFAQTVNHFENENSRWFVTESYIHANLQNPSFVDTVTTIYGFQGDSVLSNETWFKMFSTTDTTFTNNLEFQGLLRSSNGLVIFQDTASTVDTLYDFNLEVGDSMLFNFYDMYLEYLKVETVDSIEINSQMFKQIHFSEPLILSAFAYVSEVWIENIGSVHGPLFPSRPRFTSSESPAALDLTCTETNFTPFYQNSIYYQCYYSVILDTKELTRTDFNIYPNPVTETLFIQQQGQYGQFYIRDILGHEVLSGSLQSNKQSVDISQLKTGIYLVTVILENATLTKKILKY
jgi:hypothetical protein